MEGYHSPQLDVAVRVNTNESGEPPPAAFREALVEALQEITLNRYPDREARALREALGTLHGVAPEQVFCANGSNEVILCLLLAFGGPGRTAAVFEPTYALHSHLARLTNTMVATGTRGPHFRLEPGCLASVADQCAAANGSRVASVTFVCSPNNPTGAAESKEVVEEILTRSGDNLVIVDEAYAQFAPWSALELAGSFPNAAVVRTFSKTWAMAALRLGYLIADESVVEACARVALPYHLDSIKQAGGIAALRFEAEMNARVERIVEERARVVAALGAEAVEVFHSDANFVMFKVTSGSARSLWQGLVKRSVLVRDLSSWPALAGCLRVTIGTASENDRCLAALHDVLAEETSNA